MDAKYPILNCAKLEDLNFISTGVDLLYRNQHCIHDSLDSAPALMCGSQFANVDYCRIRNRQRSFPFLIYTNLTLGSCLEVLLIQSPDGRRCHWQRGVCDTDFESVQYNLYVGRPITSRQKEIKLSQSADLDH